jgi:hypothetical protein
VGEDSNWALRRKASSVPDLQTGSIRGVFENAWANLKIWIHMNVKICSGRQCSEPGYVFFIIPRIRKFTVERP